MKTGILTSGAVVAVSVAAWAMLSSDTPRPGPFRYVDVETGEIFRRPADAFIALPAKNERNGRETIFPVVGIEGGRFEIPRRHRNSLRALGESIQVKVNMETFQVEP